MIDGELLDNVWWWYQPRCRDFFTGEAFDFVPEKPLSASRIMALGKACDDVENLPRWRIENADVQREYMIALRDRVWYEAHKLEHDGRIPWKSEGLKLRNAQGDARARTEQAIAAGASVREILDARGAEAMADERYYVTERKWRKAVRDGAEPKNYFILGGKKIMRRKPHAKT